MNYDEFIKNKALVIESAGIDISTDELNPLLFDFQKDIVRWALAKGRAAIFADCGLGKTAMQLEWAEQVMKRTGGKVIVIAPLAVASQTKEGGAKFGIDVNICASQADVVADMINITNYEKLEKFTGSEFTAVVLALVRYSINSSFVPGCCPFLFGFGGVGEVLFLFPPLLLLAICVKPLFVYKSKFFK